MRGSAQQGNSRIRPARTGGRAAPGPAGPAAASSQMPDKVRQNLEKANAMAKTLDKATHYVLLGLSKDADGAEVRTAFRALARELHVDRFKRYGLEERTMSRIQKVFIAINRAHTVLSDPEQRREYDIGLEMKAKGGKAAKMAAEGGGPNIGDVFKAEKLVREGLNLLKNAKGETAVERFKIALEITPDDLLGQAGMAYAEFLVIQGRGNSPTAITRAKDKLEKITAEFSNREEPWLYLGRLYKLLDSKDAAKAAFLKALKANAHCVEAKSELRHLQRKAQSSQRTGLFGRRKG